MNAAVLDEIHQTDRVCDSTGQAIDVAPTSIDRRERQFLAELIASDDSIRRTLEVGCAYGVASLSICRATAGRRGAHHTILDPYQSERWGGVGRQTLLRAGCEHFELREEPSEIALPALLDTHEGEFDLIFIDGYHTFDHVMVDLFYATRLVRIGGYVVLDDTNWRSIAKVMSYYLRYPAYRRCGGSASRSHFGDLYRKLLWGLFPPALAGWVLPHVVYDRLYARQLFTAMTAIQKVGADKRPCTWFPSF